MSMKFLIKLNHIEMSLNTIYVTIDLVKKSFMIDNKLFIYFLISNLKVTYVFKLNKN